jgi:hypothetical protein
MKHIQPRRCLVFPTIPKTMKGSEERKIRKSQENNKVIKILSRSKAREREYFQRTMQARSMI